MDIQNQPDWVSIASLAVSFGAVFFSWLTSNKANNIQNGMIELELRQTIENSRSKIGDISMIMAPLKSKSNARTISDEEKETLKIYDKNLDSSIESMLNTYDDACAKYLDKKIDKIRFKKTFHVEIRNLIENTDLKKYFDPVNSRYKPILKVYNEWENHEQ